jgi:RNA polymerase sigma factor (sigma-70 family)
MRMEGDVLAGPGGRDRKAYEAFVETHYRGVYRFFLWLTNDPDASFDLTQETFAAFWESTAQPGRQGQPGLDLKAWLYGIARNRWRKRCRDGCRDLVSLEEALDVPDPTPGPEAEAVAGLEAGRVARAVAELPADLREALVLRVFEELAYSQIAAALGIREGLARWRVHRARLALRAALDLETGKEASGAACS